MSVVYAQEQQLSVEDYCAVLATTYMGDRRPLGNPERVAAMLAGSNMIVTARDDETGAILGVARAFTDGAWVCYLADLVVRAEQQRRGIGTGMLDKMKEIVGPGIGIVLMAYPQAVDYYRKAGLGEMTAFFIDREDRS